MGHRYVQAFESEESAFRHAIKKLHSVSLLIDLVDSYKGIDLALKLKSEYRDSDKKIWVRLDSGDIKDQVRYYLSETNRLGLTDPKRDKLVVEGIDGFEEIKEIEEMIEVEFGKEAKKRVMYGAGGLLISENTSRSDASTGFKLSEYTDERGALQPSMKFSNSPGKVSYPGATRLALVDGQRKILQMEEAVLGEVHEFFQPFYMNGIRYEAGLSDSDANVVVKEQYERIFQGRTPTKQVVELVRATPSSDTGKKITKVRRLYDLELV
jgi:nicotinic acid phosphoribosyltransferase